VAWSGRFFLLNTFVSMPIKLQELVLIYRREKIRWDNVAILECEEIENENRQNSSVVHPHNAEDETGCNHDQTSQGTQTVATCGRGTLGVYTGRSKIIHEPSRDVIVKCECPPDELVCGLSYRFYGSWNNHERHGKQFLAKTYVRVQPHGRAGVIRYLTTTCAGNGVGQQTAIKLWDKFGGDAVRILRESPEVAVAAVAMPHFTEEKATASSRILQEEQALEAVHIDLIDLLGGRGFPRDTAKKAVGEWGNKAAELIRKNPYLLMRFRGCGYLRTDQLYLDQGGRPAALKRQALAAWYAIARDTDGNTWHRPETVEAGVRARVAGAEVAAVPAMILAKRGRLISVQRNGDGVPWLAERKKADNERTVAEHVRQMLSSPVQWPEVDGLDISLHQRAELQKALAASVSCFGGSPGTGKTYSAARLIGRIMELCSSDQVAVCAPTGKAAVRITEALNSYGIEKNASTIHRLLGVAAVSAGDGWAFQHNEQNPLEQKYFVLDEGSMVDADLASSFLRALPMGAHLLIVGDVYQLPPVGHGCPLRDLLAAQVPAGDLVEIHRNAGSIVRACKAIREGKPWRYDKELDPENGLNLVLEETRSNAESLEGIVRTLHKLRSLGIDPIWDTQVLVTVNKKSELSRVEVNKRLQNELNPDGQRANGCPFRVGDKIIRIKRNTLMPCADHAGPDENTEAIDGKVLVCNGEQGRVVGVESKRAFAKFDGGRFIVIPFGKRGDDEGDGSGDDDDNQTTTGCDFDLGYGCTVHKFQGSECKVVLWGLDDSGGAMRLGCRELFYTGLSRAKFFTKHFGKKSTADAMCARRSIMRRKTFLRELIEGTVK
jgi:exodeoxyribonuclease V alpha subunit